MPADLPPVALDADLFKQALLNLLLNAQQAMPDGGEITLQAVRDGDGVVMSVIDTGKGMAPEVLARAFRPFFSTRTGGTGLGLPTTRKIILAHHATLDAESEVGHGTKFTIRLPAVPPPQLSPQAAPGDEREERQQITLKPGALIRRASARARRSTPGRAPHDLARGCSRCSSGTSS